MARLWRLCAASVNEGLCASSQDHSRDLVGHVCGLLVGFTCQFDVRHWVRTGHYVNVSHDYSFGSRDVMDTMYVVSVRVHLCCAYVFVGDLQLCGSG